VAAKGSPSLRIRIGLDDKAAIRELKNLRRQFRRSATEINSSLELVSKGTRLIAGPLMGIGRALAGAAKEAGEFQRATAEVVTIANKAEFPLSKINEITKELGATYGGPVKEQAKGLYQAISAGATDAKSAIKILSVANELSIGGLTSLNNSVDMLTSVVNVYGAATTDARDVSDSFFLAIREGKTDAEQLAAVIGSIAPVAKSVGVSYQELLSALAAITSQGVSTSEAATSLVGVFSALQKQTSKSQKEAKRLGIEFSVAALRAKGLSTFLSEIVNNSKRTDSTLVTLAGRTEALKSILALTNENGKKFNSTLSEMDKRAGLTRKAFKIMADTFGERMKMTSGLFQQAKIDLGEFIIKNEDFKALIDDIDESLKEVIAEIRDNGPQIRETVSEFARGIRSIALTVKENRSEFLLLLSLFAAAKVLAGIGSASVGIAALGGITGVATAGKIARGIATNPALIAGAAGTGALLAGLDAMGGTLDRKTARAAIGDLPAPRPGQAGYVKPILPTRPSKLRMTRLVNNEGSDLSFGDDEGLRVTGAGSKIAKEKEAAEKKRAAALKALLAKRKREIERWRRDEIAAKIDFERSFAALDLLRINAETVRTDAINELNAERAEAMARGNEDLAAAIDARIAIIKAGTDAGDEASKKEIDSLRDREAAQKESFKRIHAAVANGVASSISSIIQATAEGEAVSAKMLGKLVGGVIRNLGIMLVQMGTSALVLQLFSLIPAMAAFAGPPGMSAAAGAASLVAGASMIALGSSMGSSSGSTGSTARPSLGGGRSSERDQSVANARARMGGASGVLPRGFVANKSNAPIQNVFNVTFGRGVVFGTPTEIARKIGDLTDDRSRLRLGMAGA